MLFRSTRSADGEPDERLGLPAWQAKLARAQLRRLDKTASERAAHATMIKKLLAKQQFGAAFGDGAVPLRVPVLVRDRQNVLAKLAEQGLVLNDTWYDVPVGPPRLFGKSAYVAHSCPLAEKLAKHLLNIPTHAGVAAEELKKAIAIINQELL